MKTASHVSLMINKTNILVFKNNNPKITVRKLALSVLEIMIYSYTKDYNQIMSSNKVEPSNRCVPQFKHTHPVCHCHMSLRSACTSHSVQFHAEYSEM